MTAGEMIEELKKFDPTLKMAWLDDEFLCMVEIEELTVRTDTPRRGIPIAPTYLVVN